MLYASLSLFLNKIRTVCPPFNAWRLKTVALTQKLISVSATLSCGHQVLKDSRALEGHTYITKTLFHPTKLCIFEWTSQSDTLKLSFNLLKECLGEIHSRTVQSECVHFSWPFLLGTTVCWNLACSAVHSSKGLDWSFYTSCKFDTEIWLECKRFMLLKIWTRRCHG